MRLRSLLACLLLALPAAALAAERVEDRDDSAGALDLAEVRASHNRVTDELVFVIDFHEPVSPRTLLNRDGPPGSICLNAWTTRRPGEAAPNYDVCVGTERRGRTLRASVSRHGSTGGVRRTGSAKVKQTSETRLELRVDPDRLRRPRSFRWTMQTATFSGACSQPTGCEDYVPDRPRSAELPLRAPRRAGRSR